MSTDRSQRDRRQEEIAALILLLAQAAVVLWVNASPFQRHQMIMAAARVLETAAGRPHRAAGQAGMSAELKAGSETAAAGRYELAYWLGRARTRAAAWYEGLSA